MWEYLALGVEFPEKWPLSFARDPAALPNSRGKTAADGGTEVSGFPFLQLRWTHPKWLLYINTQRNRCNHVLMMGLIRSTASEDYMSQHGREETAGRRAALHAGTCSTFKIDLCRDHPPCRRVCSCPPCGVACGGFICSVSYWRWWAPGCIILDFF